MKVTLKELKSLIAESVEAMLSEVEPRPGKKDYEEHEPQFYDSDPVDPVASAGPNVVSFDEPDEDRDMLCSVISDMYKEVTGVRPRHFNWDEMSIDQLKGIQDDLQSQINDMIPDEDELNSWENDYPDFPPMPVKPKEISGPGISDKTLSRALKTSRSAEAEVTGGNQKGYHGGLGRAHVKKMANKANRRLGKALVNTTELQEKKK